MRLRISENNLYLLAFIFALSVRLLNLGAAPLNDSEAQWAVQALDLGRGATVIGAQPGYVILTGALFNLAHATNALARFLPALLGSLIVFFPAYLRAAGSRLNFPRTAALVLAFGLALDPTLSVLSRQVGSAVPAVTCLALVLAAGYARRPIAAGVFGGLALLSGPAILQGTIGLALAYGLILIVQKADWITPLGSEEELPAALEKQPAFGPNLLRSSLYALGITVLIAGTLFLAYPMGISGLAASLTSFISGWGIISAVSPATPLAALIFYETLPFIFGGLGIFMGWYKRDALTQRFSLWLMTALLLAILYPARQTGDIAWALIPLWALAALALDSLSQSPQEDKPLRPIAVSHATFLLVLFVVMRLNLLAWQYMGTEQTIRIWLTIGIVAMATIATFMVGIGWSLSLARDGLTWAVVAGSVLSLLAGTFWGTQVRPYNSYELWNVPPVVGQVDLVIKTIQHFSNSDNGLNEAIEIVSTVDTPAMKWALREFPNTRFVAQLAITEQPAVVITWEDQAELESSSSYRGQDFVWAVYPGWQGALPPTWLPWLAFREAPLAYSDVIVWVRGDLFPATIKE